MTGPGPCGVTLRRPSCLRPSASPSHTLRRTPSIGFGLPSQIKAVSSPDPSPHPIDHHGTHTTNHHDGLQHQKQHQKTTEQRQSLSRTRAGQPRELYYLGSAEARRPRHEAIGRWKSQQMQVRGNESRAPHCTPESDAKGTSASRPNTPASEREQYQQDAALATMGMAMGKEDPSQIRVGSACFLAWPGLAFSLSH